MWIEISLEEKTLKNKIKYFIRCYGINCRAIQELAKGIKTKSYLCKACGRTLIYTIKNQIPGILQETHFQRIEIITYGVAHAPRRTRARR